MVKRHTRRREWKRFGSWQKALVKGFFKIAVPVIFLGLAAGIFFGIRNRLYADPYFQIERVSVFPSGLLSESEYRALESAFERKNLFQISLRGISKKLEQNPAVKRAEVIRSFPNQLKILLTPRTSLLQIRSWARGPYYSVSEDRMIVSVSDVPRSGFAVVEDFSSGKKAYDRGMIYQNIYFPAWGRFFEKFYQDPVLGSESVAKFSVDHLGNMTAVLADGIELRFSNTPEIPAASETVLRTLLHSPERKNISYLDLRYQDVIVKRRSDEK